MAVNAVLSLLSFLVPLLTGGRLGGAYLSVDQELSLPTAWTVVMLGGAAGGSALLAWLARHRSRPVATAWAGVGALAALMALDEGTMLHDRAFRIADWILPGHGIYFGWLLLGVPVAVVVIGLLLWLAAFLPRLPRRLLVLGFGIFFAGAIGVESLTSALLSREVVSMGSLPYAGLAHVEEFLELTGVALILSSPLAAVAVGQTAGGLFLRERAHESASPRGKGARGPRA